MSLECLLNTELPPLSCAIVTFARWGPGRHHAGTATVQGTLTCTCVVDGRTGTLTLRFEGTQAGPAAPVDGQFVVQDATGGLAGLRGTGTFHDVGPAGTYTVRYHFDP